MSLSPSLKATRPSPNSKEPWEDPGFVLERHLLARAQEGTETDETWAIQRLLGPLNISQGLC